MDKIIRLITNITNITNITTKTNIVDTTNTNTNTNHQPNTTNNNTNTTTDTITYTNINTNTNTGTNTKIWVVENYTKPWRCEKWRKKLNHFWTRYFFMLSWLLCYQVIVSMNSGIILNHCWTLHLFMPSWLLCWQVIVSMNVVKIYLQNWVTWSWQQYQWCWGDSYFKICLGGLISNWGV